MQVFPGELQNVPINFEISPLRKNGGSHSVVSKFNKPSARCRKLIGQEVFIANKKRFTIS